MLPQMTNAKRVVTISASCLSALHPASASSQYVRDLMVSDARLSQTGTYAGLRRHINNKGLRAISVLTLLALALELGLRRRMAPQDMCASPGLR